MVVSTWLFKILASYCSSKLARAINCPVLRLLRHYWVPDKTGSFAINWWCRKAGLWHFLLLSSLISLYLPQSVCWQSIAVCPMSCAQAPAEFLPEPHCFSVHLWVRLTLTVPITWETARKILWPKGWVVILGDLGRLPLAWHGPMCSKLVANSLYISQSDGHLHIRQIFSWLHWPCWLTPTN